MKIILNIIKIILLYHVLAVFGVVVAAFLPIVWLFLPTQVWQSIPLPRRLQLDYSQLRSIIFTSIVVLYGSILSIFVIGIEVKLLFNIDLPAIITNSNSTNNARLSLNNQISSPTSDLVTIEVIITATQPINLVQADLKFNQNIFAVKEIQQDKSFANIFVEKNFSNLNGSINITSAIGSPGFIGTGQVAKIVMERKHPGDSSLEFLSSSRVLANDGKATNILINSQGNKLLIK